MVIHSVSSFHHPASSDQQSHSKTNHAIRGGDPVQFRVPAQVAGIRQAMQRSVLIPAGTQTYNSEECLTTFPIQRPRQFLAILHAPLGLLLGLLSSSLPAPEHFEILQKENGWG